MRALEVVNAYTGVDVKKILRNRENISRDIMQRMGVYIMICQHSTMITQTQIKIYIRPHNFCNFSKEESGWKDPK